MLSLLAGPVAGLLVGLLEGLLLALCPMWSLPRSVMLSQACQHGWRGLNEKTSRVSGGVPRWARREKGAKVLAGSHQWSSDAVR